MSQIEKCRTFAALHVPGNPLILYNIWDAGSAKAVADAGAKAIATGSWSVAGAQGYADGEAVPLDLVMRIAGRIAETVDLPVTIDFEGGYAEAPSALATNIARLLDEGIVGINFEDQVVGGSGLYSPSVQHGRIEAVRRSAEGVGVPLFINARTDLFLKEKDRTKHGPLISEATDRAAAYLDAGANSLFAPGLIDPALIGQICEAVSLPVNIMMMKGAPAVAELASLGVARISHGPGPYNASMAGVADRFKKTVLGS